MHFSICFWCISVSFLILMHHCICPISVVFKFMVHLFVLFVVHLCISSVSGAPFLNPTPSGKLAESIPTSIWPVSSSGIFTNPVSSVTPRAISVPSAETITTTSANGLPVVRFLRTACTEGCPTGLFAGLDTSTDVVGAGEGLDWAEAMGAVMVNHKMGSRTRLRRRVFAPSMCLWPPITDRILDWTGWIVANCVRSFS